MEIFCYIWYLNLALNELFYVFEVFYGTFAQIQQLNK